MVSALQEPFNKRSTKYRCCIPGCGNTTKLHRFPVFETGVQKWVDCIGCEKLRSLSFQELRNRVVCQKHFEKKFYSSSRIRSRLRVDAYPTLFTVSEIESGISQRVYTELTKYPDHEYTQRQKHFDHSYCKTADKNIDNDNSLSSLPVHAVEYPGIKDLDNDHHHFTSPENRSNLINEFPKTEDFLIRKTPRKIGRNRIIYKVKNLNPISAKLYQLYTKTRRQLEHSRRSRKAMKLSNEEHFEKLTKNMKPLAKKFFWMQINNSKSSTPKEHGRRFTNVEKVIALSIRKQSPKCYSFLRKLFVLPSKRTLNKIVVGFNIGAGNNLESFENLKLEGTLEEKNQYYSILFADDDKVNGGTNHKQSKNEIKSNVEMTESMMKIQAENQTLRSQNRELITRLHELEQNITTGNFGLDQIEDTKSTEATVKRKRKKDQLRQNVTSSGLYELEQNVTTGLYGLGQIVTTTEQYVTTTRHYGLGQNVTSTGQNVTTRQPELDIEKIVKTIPTEATVKRRKKSNLLGQTVISTRLYELGQNLTTGLGRLGQNVISTGQNVTTTEQIVTTKHHELDIDKIVKSIPTVKRRKKNNLLGQTVTSTGLYELEPNASTELGLWQNVTNVELFGQNVTQPIVHKRKKVQLSQYDQELKNATDFIETLL